MGSRGRCLTQKTRPSSLDKCLLPHYRCWCTVPFYDVLVLWVRSEGVEASEKKGAEFGSNIFRQRLTYCLSPLFSCCMLSFLRTVVCVQASFFLDRYVGRRQATHFFVLSFCQLLWVFRGESYGNMWQLQRRSHWSARVAEVGNATELQCEGMPDTHTA